MADHCTAFGDLLGRLRGGDSRQLLRITAELTHRCELCCAHCYCRLPADSGRAGEELSGSEWERILAEGAEEGALLLVLTGGDPLLHRDFRQVWLAAKRLGYLPEVFTSATSLTPELADFLAEWPPLQVSVTLYGATEETYARTTGRPGMLARALAGLELLRERGIAIEAKALFSRSNVHEFDAIRELAGRYGAPVRWNAELVGSAPGCHGSPDAVRLSAAEVVALELRDRERWQAWTEEILPFEPAPARPDTPFRCQVGSLELNVDPYGVLQPCLLLSTRGYDLRRGSVREGWRKAVPEMLAELAWSPGPCQACSLATVCRLCPAVAARTGAPAAGPSDFHCALGQERARALGLAAQPAPSSGGQT